MFKKVCCSLAALAFLFGGVSKTKVFQNITNACSCICCDHNGDMWDN
nr:MAG TPA: hypothetical protein [Caudoviricetes sp.]